MAGIPGYIYSFGDNNHGQLGIGAFTPYPGYPIQLIGEDNTWVAISTGFMTAYAINQSNELYSWGYANYGYGLGTGNTNDVLFPTRVGTDYWISVSASAFSTNSDSAFVLAIKDDGSLWFWGETNTTPKLKSKFPKQLSEDNDWAFISAGNGFGLAIKSDGTLWSIGSNYYGQLGSDWQVPPTGENYDSLEITQIGTDTDWSQVSCGMRHSVAIKTTGAIYATGANYYGNLGQGNTTKLGTFTQIGNSTDWVQIVAGNDTTLVLDASGNLWACGNAGSFIFGSALTGSILNLTQLTDFGAFWSSVSIGEKFVLGLDQSQYIYGCGLLSWFSSSNMNQLDSMNGWISISAGQNFGLAIIPYPLFPTTTTSTTTTTPEPTTTSSTSTSTSSTTTSTTSTTPEPTTTSTTTTIGPETFVVVARNSDEVALTRDGINWGTATLPSSDVWNCVAYGNNIFVAVAKGTNNSATSVDGFNWYANTLPDTQDWQSLKFANGLFVLIASKTDVVLSSTDGITWSTGSMPSVDNWIDVSYIELSPLTPAWIAIAHNSDKFATSIDAVIWVEYSLPNIGNWTKVFSYFGKQTVVIQTTYTLPEFTTTTTTTTTTTSTSSTTSTTTTGEPTTTSTTTTGEPTTTSTTTTGEPTTTSTTTTGEPTTTSTTTTGEPTTTSTTTTGEPTTTSTTTTGEPTTTSTTTTGEPTTTSTTTTGEPTTTSTTTTGEPTTTSTTTTGEPTTTSTTTSVPCGTCDWTWVVPGAWSQTGYCENLTCYCSQPAYSGSYYGEPAVTMCSVSFAMDDTIYKNQGNLQSEYLEAQAGPFICDGECTCIWDGSSWSCSVTGGDCTGCACYSPTYNGSFVGQSVSFPCVTVTTTTTSTTSTTSTSTTSTSTTSTSTTPFPAPLQFLFSYDLANWGSAYTANGQWQALDRGNSVYIALATDSATATKSSDSFNWFTNDLPYSTEWNSIKFNRQSKIFLAVSNSDFAATTINGTTWNARGITSSQDWAAITAGYSSIIITTTTSTTTTSTTSTSTTSTSSTTTLRPATTTTTTTPIPGVFVAVASSTNIVAKSLDGITWVTRNLPLVGDWVDIAYGNYRYVAIAANNNIVAVSWDGDRWWIGILPATRAWKAITWGIGGFIAIAANSNAGAISTDGVNWTEITLPSTQIWTDIEANNNGIAIAIADNSNVLAYSWNGVDWTQVTLPAYGLWKKIVSGANYFVIIQEGNSFLYSLDGKNWGITYVQNGLWNNIEYCSNTFYVTQPNSDFSLISYNGYVWTNSSTLPSSATWSASTYSQYHNKSVLISASSAAAISTNCSTWTSISLPLSLSWNAIISSEFFIPQNSSGSYNNFGGGAIQNELGTTTSTTTTSTTPRPLPTGANAYIAEEFANYYNIEDLGPIYGYDSIYAVCLYQPNPLYILVSAEKNGANLLLKVPVNRDPLTKRIRSFGIPEVILETPLLIWGGLSYGPNGILFATPNKQNYDYTRYVYQIDPDFVWESTDLAASTLPEINGLGSISVAPDGFYNAGQAVLISINEGRFYKYDLTPIEGESYFSFSNPTFGAPIDKTPAGFSYPNRGSTNFPNQSILVSEYDTTGVIAAYDIYQSGGANLSTKRVFVKNIYSPIGSTIDPFTGDLLFTHFNPCTGKRAIYIVYGGFLPYNKRIAPEGLGGYSGYFCGGGNLAGATPFVDKISYASDITVAGNSGLNKSYQSAVGLSDGRLIGFVTDGLQYLETMPYSTEVFSVTDSTLSRQRLGISSANFLNAFGFVFGGERESRTSDAIDQLSFNTGVFTAVNAILSTARRDSCAFSDFNKYAYIFGGFNSNSGNLLSVEQFIYSISVTFISTSTLGALNTKLACISSYANFGFVSGGTTNGTTANSAAYKVNFSNSVISFIQSGQLQDARYGAGGLSQGTIKGYYQSGKNDQYFVTSAEKFVYYLETSVLSPVSAVRDARTGMGTFGKLYTFIPQGYMAGGLDGSTSSTNITEKIIFNADVIVAKDTANLSAPKLGLTGVSDEDLVAYFVGGATSNVEPYGFLNTVDKLLYETEVTSSIAVILDEPRSFAFGFSDKDHAAYFAGGNTGSYTNTCEKITYSNDSHSTVAITLQSVRMAGLSAYSYTKGYMAGGKTTLQDSTNIIEALTYSTETLQTLSIVLPTYKSFGGGVSFRNMRAFFVCGIEQNAVSATTSLLDMIVDSISVSTPTPLSNFGFGIVSDGYSKGYICGGTGFTNLAQILNFNTYATAISTSAAISPRSYLTGVSKIYKDAYYSYYGSGTILLYGTSKAIFKLSYGGSGTILLYGSSEVTISIDLYLPINYRIQKTITKFLPINYQVGRKVYYAYRVEGDCIPIKKCGDAPFVNAAIECPVRSIQTIVAASVQEVCRKLTDQNWIWPIKRFQKYSKPIYKVDEDYLKQYGLYNEECVVFEDQNFCNFNDCIDFCADYLVDQIMIIEDKALLEDNNYVGSGTIYVSGKAKTVTTAWNYIGTGNINLLGIAPFSVSIGVIQTRHYTGRGSLELNGEAPATYGNVGTFDQQMVMVSEIENYKIIYSSTKGLPINTAALNTNLTICDCKNIQSRFNLITNLNKSSIFTNFLASNNLLFSKNLIMKYNFSKFAFFYNQQYSIGRPASEQWILNVSLTSEVDDNAANDKYKWFLNVHFLNRKRIENTATFDNNDANVRVWIPSRILCPTLSYKNMNFSFQINLNSGICTTSAGDIIKDVYINDNIGVFSSGDWMQDPILKIAYAPLKESATQPIKPKNI